MAVGTPRTRLGVGIFVLAAAVYLPTLGHDWLNYDDDVYITDNPEQRRGLTPEGVGWALRSFHGANWFPLTRLSWALDLEIYGLSAAGFHATSAILHATSALLLFLALARLTGSAGRSAFVAAVFAVHPLHVESVAWAAARKDPLSALFFVTALWIYAGRGRRGPGLRTQLALMVCLALGLLAKPIVASLPAVLLLLDGWPLGRLRRPPDGAGVRRALLEKLPMLAMVAGFAVVAFAAQRAGGAVAPIEQLPLGARVGNALVSYVAYLGKAFWPTGLAVFYPHRGVAIPFWQVAGAASTLAATTALALASARRRPYLTVGWLWYVVTLLPAIGLIQVGSQAMADRYMYLPLIGLAIALTWGVCDLARQGPALRSPSARCASAREAGGRASRRLGLLAGAGARARAALPAAALTALACLSIVTLLQLRHWRDSEALFRHALEVTDRNSVAHAHLGAALLEQGRVDETLFQFARAVDVEPSFLRASNNLSWLLATLPDASQRDPDSALRLARRAASQTGYEDAAVLDTLAAAQASSGRFAEAVRSAELALALAETGGDAALARDVSARLELYRAGRPYREAAPVRRRASR